MLTNPPASGDGSVATPYLADVATDYVFQVLDAGLVDHAADPLCTYTVTDGAGTMAAGVPTLNIDDVYNGTFTVTATFGADTTDPLTFQVGGPGGELEIYPDPADTDWNAPVTGAGTEADPYVLDSADLTKIYSLLADDKTGAGGALIPVASLTWDGYPPFVGTWTEPGSFQANQFTAGTVYAQDATTLNSNDLYVEIHLLP